jgi:hypothetical protein
VSLRTEDAVLRPIDGEMGQSEALARLGLPTRIRGHRTHDLNAVLLLTVNHHRRIDIPCIDDMLAGE